MTTEPTDEDKIRRLPWLVAYNATNAVFCVFTVFGSVFILFLDHLGLTKTRIGFILSLMPFCGPVALFIAPAVARIGRKRTYVTFWGIRKVVTGFLLLTPWVLSRFGIHATFIFVTGIIAAFALCRAIAETGLYPWSQEMVPYPVRGRFFAINNTIATAIACIAVAIAGYTLGHSAGINRFMGLIAVGIVFGFASVSCMLFLPGGAPVQTTLSQSAHFRNILKALHDRDFLFYIAGVGMVILGFASFSFTALFMKEQVGLRSGNIVFLDFAGMAAGIVSGFMWGHFADRRGGKPVIFAGLSILALLPVCYYMTPRHSNWSYPAAMLISFIGGLGGVAWSTGFDREFFVNVVPSEKKTEYMAIFYTLQGLIGGSGPLIAGWVLDRFKGLEGKLLIFPVDRYTPLFAMGVPLFVTGILLINRVRGKHR